MKLCTCHNKTVHKAVTVKDQTVPCCNPRSAFNRGLFDKRGYYNMELFDGEESQITCKKCLNKIRRRKKK